MLTCQHSCSASVMCCIAATNRNNYCYNSGKEWNSEKQLTSDMTRSFDRTEDITRIGEGNDGLVNRARNRDQDASSALRS